MSIAAIFDLDGVLVDSHAQLCAALDHACLAAGVSPPPHAHFLAQMGRPLRRILAELGLPADLAPAFRAHAAAGVDEIRVFPGAREMLESARGARARVAILTGKERARAEVIVARLGFEPLIDLLVTSDDAPPKPDPRAIGHILDRLGCSVSGSIYVGDSLIDMQTARGAGVRAVFATWGAAAEVPAHAYDARLDDPAGFPALMSAGSPAPPGRQKAISP